MGNVSKVQLSNIRVHDPMPSLNAFQIDESDGAPGAAETRTSTTHRSFHDVSFVNIKIANLSSVRKCAGGSGCNCVPACAAGGPLPAGVPNALRGGKASSGNEIMRVRFDNVTIGGFRLSELDRIAPGWLNMSGTVTNITSDGLPLLPLAL